MGRSQLKINRGEERSGRTRLFAAEQREDRSQTNSSQRTQARGLLTSKRSRVPGGSSLPASPADETGRRTRKRRSSRSGLGDGGGGGEAGLWGGRMGDGVKAASTGGESGM
jgi:hypothetical protein